MMFVSGFRWGSIWGICVVVVIMQLAGQAYVVEMFKTEWTPDWVIFPPVLAIMAICLAMYCKAYIKEP